jgi:integrase
VTPLPVVTAREAIQIWRNGICGCASVVGEQNEALFALLFLTGFRIADLIHARWSHVDLQGLTMRLYRRRMGRNPARGEGHSLPIPPHAVTLLRVLQTRHAKSDPCVFRAQNAPNIGGRRAQWHKVRERTELPTFQLRDLRGVAPMMKPGEWTPYTFWAGSEERAVLARIFTANVITW